MSTPLSQLATRIDRGLDSYIASMPLPETLEEAIADRDFWIREACRFSRNEDYYRWLVDQVGALLGDEVYVADDGSRPGGILRAKVPELVAARLVT